METTEKRVRVKDLKTLDDVKATINEIRSLQQGELAAVFDKNNEVQKAEKEAAKKVELLEERVENLTRAIEVWAEKNKELLDKKKSLDLKGYGKLGRKIVGGDLICPDNQTLLELLRKAGLAVLIKTTSPKPTSSPDKKALKKDEYKKYYRKLGVRVSPKDDMFFIETPETGDLKKIKTEINKLKAINTSK